MKALLLAATAGVILFTSPASAANLLTNGSFEQGLTGWTLGGDIGAPPLAEPPVVIPYNSSAGYPNGAHGEPIPAPGATGNPGFDPVGDNALYFVADGPGPQTLSQTVSVGSGTYKMGFDFYLPQNGFNNQGNAKLTALLDGVAFASFIASTQTPQVWDHFTTTMVIPTPGTVTFVFSYEASSFPAKDFVIDRAYLAAVPEPASWAMMIGGFALAGAASRRRKTSLTLA